MNTGSNNLGPVYCCCFTHLCCRPRWVPRQETWPNQPPGHRHTAPWCNCCGSAPGRRAIQAHKLPQGPHLHQSGPGPTHPAKAPTPSQEPGEDKPGLLGASPRGGALSLELQSSLLPGRAWKLRAPLCCPAKWSSGFLCSLWRVLSKQSGAQAKTMGGRGKGSC